MTSASHPAPETLVSPCPGCGRPRPIRGAERERCATCGQEHPVEAALLRAAKVYGEAHRNLPLQVQQTAHLGALAADAEATLRRLRVASALLGAPLLVLAGYGVELAGRWATDATRPAALHAPALIVPLGVLLGAAGLAWRRLAARRADVASLLAARPLADVPGELGCRMCGGPLGANEAQAATAKCRYCGTENIVSPEVTRRAASLAVADYAEHARQVLARLERGRAWSAYGALAAPLLALGALHLAGRAAEHHYLSMRLPPNTSDRFVKRRCKADPRWSLKKVGSRVFGSCDGQADAIEAPLVLASLRGARGPGCYGPRSILDMYVGEWTVEAVFSDGLGRNLVEVKPPLGAKRVCLVDGFTVNAQ